jgi:hypothetical protein
MEILTIIAIVIGPILAIQVQKLLERKREEKERSLWVFKILMVTRGAVLSPLHVEALNSIDIEFNANSDKDKNVRNAWKAYLDELAHYPKDGEDDDKKRWVEKINVLLIELLSVMSVAVGYDFDKTYIKRTAYTPVKYSDIELEQDFIRRSLVKLFLGDTSIPIKIITSTETAAISSEEKLRKLLIEHYEGNKPIRVVIEEDKRIEKPEIN